MTDNNVSRIKKVEQTFEKPENLCIPGRILLGEGTLVKVCRKTEQPRKILLFNDILILAKISKSKKLYDTAILQLEDVVISNVPFSEGYENAWNIISPKKSFMVYASSPSEKIEWMTHINRYCELCRAKMGKTEPLAQAAVWVPDSEALTCMACKDYTFSAIKRRHHCRKCGKVVCGPCSTHRIVIPNISDKPQRVCLECYVKISKKQENLLNQPQIPLDVGDVKNEEHIFYGDDF